jgi:nicotinamidase-related amidase
MSDLVLDPRQTAIVVIDLQRGILQLTGAPHPMQTVLSNVTQLVAQARTSGARVVLVRVDTSTDGGDRVNPIADEPARMRGPMPVGWSDLATELNQQPDDIVVVKRQWGAFYGTDLDLHLRRRSIRTIVLCGVATEFGVESTSRDAYERGYEQVFAEDAMTGLTVESHENAMKRVFPRLGRIRSTAEIIAGLNITTAT